MVKVNNLELNKFLKVNKVTILDSYKNNFLDDVSNVIKTTRLSGRITISCTIESKSDNELTEKLNSIEGILKDGLLEIQDKVYEVTLLQGINQGEDTCNFDIIFCWNGYAYIDGERKDLAK